MTTVLLILGGILTLVVASVGVLAYKGWLPTIQTANGRRAWALLALLGGCVVFTSFSAVAVWLLSGNEEYTFYLAIAAHLQLAIGMGTLGGLLVRRSVKVTKEGLEYEDLEVIQEVITKRAE